MRKQVTIKDIAKAAGVTPSTVSCILNKKPLPFKEETVKKVNRIAREMGYTANVLARGLVKGKTNTIGIVFIGNTDEPFNNSFIFSIVSSACNVLNHMDYNIYFSVSKMFADVSELEDHIHSVFGSGRVDGVIIIGPPLLEYHDSLRNLKYPIPFVLLGRIAGVRKMNMVDVDNEEMGYKAIAHLAERGCRKVGFIAAENSYQFDIDRMAGVRRAIEELGLEHDEAWGMINTDRTFELISKKVMDLVGVVDGLYIWDNSVMGTIVNMIMEKRLSIPEDFKLICDEDISLQQISPIKFTMMRIDSKEVGRLAARLIDEKVRGVSEHHTQTFIDPIILQGATT